jgi:hypothetical protein
MAPKDGQVQGFKHHDKVDKFNVEMTLLRPLVDAESVRVDDAAGQHDRVELRWVRLVQPSTAR